MLLLANKIIYPTFKSAQQLYTHYSTIENTTILYSNLIKNIDSSYLSTMPDENIHKIYNKIIMNYYPNEICIKSSFIKQILLNGRNHVTIFELPVGSSRADLCKINGESIAYEIKTDLDNLTRLKKQIKDYYKIFDKVYIICSESNVENVIKIIPEKCGIYSYKQNKFKNYRFTLVRSAILENEISPLAQLKLIRKCEFFSHFTLDYSLKNRSEIINYINQNYSSDSINTIFKRIIKQRFQKQWTFLKQNYNDILEIDYQWFYKNQIPPSHIYK